MLQLAAPVPATSVADEIEKLPKLRDQGILTPAEFEATKKSLLGLRADRHALHTLTESINAVITGDLNTVVTVSPR